MKESIYKQKGQASGSIGAVISLIIGVGVSVLVLIFVGVLGGQAYNIAEPQLLEIGNTPVTNQVFTIINNSATGLGATNIHTGSLTVFNNSIPRVEFGLGNFTIDYSAGTILLKSAGVTNGPVNNSILGANYSHGEAQIRESIISSVRSGFSALEDTGGYLPLIVLGIIIFIVLSLVLGLTLLTGGKPGKFNAL